MKETPSPECRVSSCYISTLVEKGVDFRGGDGGRQYLLRFGCDVSKVVG